MATTASVGPASVTVPFSLTLTAQPNNVSANGPWTYISGTLSQGTAAGQADTVYKKQISLVASGTTTLNLSSLTDDFGDAIAFARLKCLYVENSKSALSTNVAMGDAGSNPFSGMWSPGTAVVNIRNGVSFWSGICMDATGWVVSTGVNLLFTNSDSVNAALLNILIAGCSV